MHTLNALGIDWCTIHTWSLQFTRKDKQISVIIFISCENAMKEISRVQ